MRESRREDLLAEDRELLEAAEKARGHAYAPYSKYRVGAAVKAQGGEIFAGCNVEIVTYNATHAERNAIDTMAAHGKRKIKTLAVVSGDGGFPCAECRQAIWEFCGGNAEIRILGADLNGNVVIAAIGELYPEPFGPSDLGIDKSNA